MSDAYETLMGLSEDDIATYTASPKTEEHIVIGEDRFITIPNALKRIAVQYDHNVETVTFDCPRYWDERDLSTLQIYINYILPNKEIGSYAADNVVVKDSIVHFDWTISNQITQIPGPIVFLVCAKDVDADGNEVTHWNSELNSEMYISEGLEGGVQSAMDMYPDIVTQLLARMASVEEVRPAVEEAAAIAQESATVADNAQATATLKATTAVIAMNAAKKAAVEASTAAASQVGTKADAIVRSGEGEAIILSDCSDDPLRGLRVMGRTEQVKTTGKNLVDMSEYEFDDSNYTHMLYATNSKSANDLYDLMRAHPGESIIYSMTTTGTQSGIVIGSIRFYGEDNALICALVPNTPHTIKTDLPETFTASYIYGSTTGASVKDIQVEFGTEATEYEPYTGAKPSPSPEYPQEFENVDNPTVTVNGKNLFDMSKLKDTEFITKLNDGSISVSRYYCNTSIRLNVLAPGMVVGRAYTLNLNTDGNPYIYLNDYGHTWQSGSSLILTDEIYNSPVTLYGKTEQVDGSTIIRNIQFRLADTPSGFEDYKDAQLMTIPHTLRAIPVTTNGNYTDSNGQQWICDEVDFERGVLIQRIDEIAVNNSMTYFYNTDNYFLHTGSDIFTNVAAWETRILGTHFVPIGNGIGMSDYGWFQFNGNGGIRFRIEGVDSVEALAEWFTTHTDVRVIYPYVTPIETALTAEELEAYKTLHTNRPNTIVLNSANTKIYLDYNVDTDMHVNAEVEAGVDELRHEISTEGYMHYIGTSTGIISAGSTTPKVVNTTDAAQYTARKGTVVGFGGNLYLFDGTKWCLM